MRRLVLFFLVLVKARNSEVGTTCKENARSRCANFIATKVQDVQSFQGTETTILWRGFRYQFQWLKVQIFPVRKSSQLVFQSFTKKSISPLKMPANPPINSPRKRESEVYGNLKVMEKKIYVVVVVWKSALCNVLYRKLSHTLTVISVA